MKKTIILFALFSIISVKQAIAAMPVEVLYSGTDNVGQRLVYAVKERIHSSSSLYITFDQTIPRIQVSIVTLDGDKYNSGISTCYSVAVLYAVPNQIFPYYLTNFAGYCGSSIVGEGADSIVADISEQVDSLLRLYQQK